MFSVLGTEGSSELIFIPIALVFVGSLVVIAMAGGAAVIAWLAGAALGGSAGNDSGGSGTN
jgi:hypothetical protein